MHFRLIIERERKEGRKFSKLKYADDSSSRQKVTFDFTRYHDYDKVKICVSCCEEL